jgi:cobalt-zinc-cadmium efflux system protein
MDTLGSVGVIAAGVAMRLTGWYWLDPAVSVGIGLVILPRSLLLLKESAHILLAGTPAEMDVAALTREIERIPGVEELHDLHVWTLTSGLNAASLHVRVEDDRRGRTALVAIQGLLREHGGVGHATIQVEWGALGTCETAELSF